MMIAKPIEPTALGATADETLTIEEMQARYPSEWLLIVEPVTSQEKGLESGRVVFHSPDRDEMHRKAIELQAPRIAFYYTRKKLPEGTTIIL
jgi:hypothetical protein